MKASYQYKISRIILYLLFKILFGLRIEGLSNIPESGPVIIAPNHRSNYDPPLVGCCVSTREIYCLAKSSIFTFKIATWFLKSINVIPINLKNPGIGTMRRFINLLGNGKIVMIFPEGTRSKTNEFLKAQPGVGFISIKMNAPVIPTLIEGTYESMRRHFFRISPLRVKFGAPIYPENEIRSIKEAQKLSDRILEEVKGLT